VADHLADEGGALALALDIGRSSPACRRQAIASTNLYSRHTPRVKGEGGDHARLPALPRRLPSPSAGHAHQIRSQGMTKVCTLEEAVSVVQPGQTVATVGVIGWLVPDALLGGLARRFRETGSPSDCTFYFPCGTGDAQGIKGMDHVAIEGLMKRIVSGSYINPVDPKTGKRPELMRLIRENRIEAYSWPIGASMHWLREVARRSPGYLTKIGLDTYADPKLGGGKFTALAKDDLIRRVNFEGEDYLFYPTFPLHVGFIRASTADEFGNLSFEDEPIHSSSLQIALAVKACGGTVIAQVRRVVPRGERLAAQCKVPGVLVDRVVVVADQMMKTETPFDAAFLGGDPWDGLTTDRLPFRRGQDRCAPRRACGPARRHNDIRLRRLVGRPDHPPRRRRSPTAATTTSSSRRSTALSAASS